MELKLLLGKIYSQWRGHDSQALAAYEAIIRDDPDDFRSAWGDCSLCEYLQGSSVAVHLDIMPLGCSL